MRLQTWVSPGSPAPSCGRRMGSAACCTTGATGTMHPVCTALTRILGRPVIDRTGLSGGFDRPKDAPSFDAALQESLGLKLKSTRASVRLLVVDHVVKPTPG